MAVQTRYAQIRVKSINFTEKEALAIYFYDMTHHIESLNLDRDDNEEQDRDINKMISLQTIVSKEL